LPLLHSRVGLTRGAAKHSHARVSGISYALFAQHHTLMMISPSPQAAPDTLQMYQRTIF
jgi:hypothetical protein